MKYSVLEDRILLFNGKNIVEPEHIANLLLAGINPNNIIATETNEEINQFNDLSDDIIKQYSEDTEEIVNFDYSWNIPEKYKSIDLIDYFSKFITEQNEIRIMEELQIVIDNQLENHFKCLIYIVDTFKANKQIWGVGRGSSVACYLLFLIGIHDVDCLKYNIPYSEFFH